MGEHHAFGVPLDGNNWKIFMGHSLHDAVGRMLYGDKSAAKTPDSLMVAAICGKMAGAVNLFKEAARLYKGVVDNIPVGRLMEAGSVHMLDKSSSKINVDDLVPAANTKDRLFITDKQVQKAKLGGIEQVVDLPGTEIFFTEKLGVHVISAGKEKPVILGGGIWI